MKMDQMFDLLKEFYIRSFDEDLSAYLSNEALELMNEKDDIKGFLKLVVQILDDLEKIEDKRVRDRYGVVLFGTIWEDLSFSEKKKLIVRLQNQLGVSFNFADKVVNDSEVRQELIAGLDDLVDELRKLDE